MIEAIRSFRVPEPRQCAVLVGTRQPLYSPAFEFPGLDHDFPHNPLARDGDRFPAEM
jgi:hypothetical protein